MKQQDKNKKRLKDANRKKASPKPKSKPKSKVEKYKVNKKLEKALTSIGYKS